MHYCLNIVFIIIKWLFVIGVVTLAFTIGLYILMMIHHSIDLLIKKIFKKEN